jgi:hypothetical protein
MIEQLPEKFEADIDMSNKSIEKRTETEVSNLNFVITYLREKNLRDINNINSKVNKLS